MPFWAASADAEADGLLPLVLRVGAHAAGALELEGDLVELAAHRHLLVEHHHLLVGERALGEFLVELAVLVEDLDVVDLRFVHGRDRHQALPPAAAFDRVLDFFLDDAPLFAFAPFFVPFFAPDFAAVRFEGTGCAGLPASRRRLA